MKYYDLNWNPIKQDDFYSHGNGIIQFSEMSKSSWAEYRQNHKCHRIGGPAYLWDATDTSKGLYYVNGVEVTKEQHDLLFDLYKLKGLKTY